MSGLTSVKLDTTPNSICTCQAGKNEPGAEEVVGFITKTTTPEAFEAKRATQRNYNLVNGDNNHWHAIAKAARLGNVPLIKHLLENSPACLVTLGAKEGWTPLFCAASCKDPEKAYNTAREILFYNEVQLKGRNITNIATFRGRTALWVAAQTDEIAERNFRLIKLLVQKGATAHPEPSERGKALIKKAQEEITKDFMEELVEKNCASNDSKE